ncbi:MAG: copper transporter [Mycobacteriaceae bacterium]
MISIRQHAISLAAVFLALALGIVLGTGILSDGLLSGLRSDKKDLQSQIDELDSEKNVLGEQLNSANSFDAAVSARIVGGVLAQRPVLIISTPDAYSDDIDALKKLVETAGGRVSGQIGLTDSFVNSEGTESLRTRVLGSIPPGAQLRSDVADPGTLTGDLLGLVLQLNPQTSEPQSTNEQLATALTTLRDGGFISYQDGTVLPGQLAVVVTGGAIGADAGNRGAVTARFAAALDVRGAGTVLVGRTGSAAGNAALAVARSDSALSSRLSTVDNIGVASGRISTVLALQEQLNNKTGQYGTGPGATAVTVG